MKDFALIETMRVSTNGEVYLLDRHLHRLRQSARFFNFKCDPAEVRNQVLNAAPREAACLRLTLANAGQLSLESSPLPIDHPQRLKLSTVRVNSNDVCLYHKTTNRGIYEQARRECADRTEPILINERGEITETTIMSLAVLRAGRWITPKLSCGLLPGVMRDELLARGEIVEGVIHSSELRDGELIRCFNALRGVRDIAFDYAEPR
jgi:para-aminobenzoate synthetase/4-amino-4-deoxychorismate lyase